MVSLAIWVAILWVCSGTGGRVLRALRAQAPNLAEELPCAAAIGMGVLSYLVLAVGLLGHLEAWVMLALLGLLAAIGWPDMIRLARRAPSAFRAIAPWQCRFLPVSLFLLVMFALTLIGSLAPSGDSDYDSLVYHLAMPKIYLRDGSVHFLPWLSHSNFPFTLEMLYTLGLRLGGQSLAKLFHFGCGWLALCAVFGFARRWRGSAAGWLAAAIFAAIPLVAWQMTTAYIELGAALYAFLVVYALARHFEGRASGERPGWLWVAALLCGWALGIKMLAGALLVFALLALTWSTREAPDRRRAAAHALAFTGIALAVAAPWYVKSYLWTGNPVYPFFYGIFDGHYWTADRARLYTEAQKAFGLGARPADFLLLPWDLTVHPRWFFDLPEALRPFNVYVMVFGPLLLAFAPLVLFTRPLGAPGRLALWFALVFTVIWFRFTQNGRYLIAILPGLCVCAGRSADRLIGRRGTVAGAAVLALLLGSISALYPALLLSAPAVRVVVGAEPESDYLSRVSRSYVAYQVAARLTPPSARILILGDEPRTFYLDRDYLLGNHAEIFSKGDLASPAALLAALNRMGVTHLLIHASTQHDMESRSGRLETALADLAGQGWIEQVVTCGAMTLWRIASARSAS